MSDFWRRVDEELDYKGLNRTYLAKECGFSLTNIGQGIKLGSTPSAETAVKIAKVLDVSVEYLVTGNESPQRMANPEINEIMRDIRHLSPGDLSIAKTIVHRLTEH
ncbi:MAG: helix-turn-helix transcriptional regulator [Treponema sp.]|nr:helix-turn-helix transcriptional regulator [Treponema sp.]MBR7079885.1 helix-turn-helix transcriptional regulator [Treponema sp.]